MEDLGREMTCVMEDMIRLVFAGGCVVPLFMFLRKYSIFAVLGCMTHVFAIEEAEWSSRYSSPSPAFAATTATASVPATSLRGLIGPAPVTIEVDFESLLWRLLV